MSTSGIVKNGVLTIDEFKDFFEKYFDQLRNYVFYRSGDEALSSDIVQECFMKLWLNRKKVQKDNVVSLLYSMANNLFVSKYRHEKVILQFRMNYEGQDNPITPEEEVVYKETKQKFEKILEVMPEKQRVVFLMSRMDGLKYYEIAERLGISVKAVEKRMANALQKLKSQLIVK